MSAIEEARVPFRTVGLVARRHSADLNETVIAVAETLARLGAKVLFAEDTAEPLVKEIDPHDVLARTDLGQRCDLIVVVGGDGSLLGVSREIANSGVPILGVNRGGLGFLAAVPPDALEANFEAIWSGEFQVEEHFRLHARLVRAGAAKDELASSALNDVVVHSGGVARMIEFELWIDDEYVYDQHSDGVIVASPTGSTAYSLSAGGPIMHPNLDAIAIVPMFPHTLTSRPLVVSGDATVRIKLINGKDGVQLSCDSQVNVALGPGDEVVIRKAEVPLRLVYPAGHSFYESCRSKLDWASRLGGR